VRAINALRLQLHVVYVTGGCRFGGPLSEKVVLTVPLDGVARSGTLTVCVVPVAESVTEYVPEEKNVNGQEEPAGSGPESKSPRPVASVTV
jgi:hypothetical protein